MDTTDTGCETLLHNVVVSVATYSDGGPAGVGGSRVTVVGAQWHIAYCHSGHSGRLPPHSGTIATTSQSLRNSGRLLTVIPIAILGVTLRQHPRIGQLYRTAHCRLNIAHNILHTGYCTQQSAHFGLNSRRASSDIGTLGHSRWLRLRGGFITTRQ